MALAQLLLDGFGYLLPVALGQDGLGGEAVDPNPIGPAWAASSAVSTSMPAFAAAH
jgi:hypothetical protein